MLQKIVILAVAVLAVWYGFKYLSRLADERKQRLEKEKQDAVDGVADTVQCPVCATYVAAAAAGNCGKSDCPY